MEQSMADDQRRIMEPLPPNPSSLTHFIHILSSVLIVVLLLGAPYVYWYAARMVANPDPFEYAEDAKEVLHGQKLYVGMFYNKGPLGIVFYAVPELISPRSYQALGAALGVYLDLQSLFFVWLFRRNFPIALMCSLILIVLPLNHIDWLWPGSEHIANLFAIPCLIIAFQIARHRSFSTMQCLLAGLLACFAMNVRQPALLVAIVPAVAILAAGLPMRKKIFGLGVAAAGGLIGFAIILILVLIFSDLRAYFEFFFMQGVKLASIGKWEGSLTLLRSGANQRIFALAVMFITLALESRYWLLVSTAVLVGLYSVVMTHVESMHYWVVFFPYLALIAAIALDRFGESRNFVAIVGSLVVGFALYGPAADSLRAIELNPTAFTRQAVAWEVDRLVPPDDTLLVLGDMSEFEPVVFASKCQPPDKNGVRWSWGPTYAALMPIPDDEVIADYLAHPPRVLVIAGGMMDIIGGKMPWPRTPPIQIAFGKQLLQKGHYELKEDINNYSIWLLPNANSPQNPASGP